MTIKWFWKFICYDIYIALFDALHTAANILMKHKSEVRISEEFLSCVEASPYLEHVADIIGFSERGPYVC